MLWRASQSISRTRKIRRPGKRRASFCWKPLSVLWVWGHDEKCHNKTCCAEWTFQKNLSFHTIIEFARESFTISVISDSKYIEHEIGQSCQKLKTMLELEQLRPNLLCPMFRGMVFSILAYTATLPWSKKLDSAKIVLTASPSCFFWINPVEIGDTKWPFLFGDTGYRATAQWWECRDYLQMDQFQHWLNGIQYRWFTEGYLFFFRQGPKVCQVKIFWIIFSGWWIYVEGLNRFTC